MIKDTFVLVGGSHDGDRVEADLSTEVVKKVNFDASVHPIDVHTPLSEIGGVVVYEYYTRRVFFSDPSHWHIVYALDSMLHHEVVDALFARYQPIESDASFRDRLKKKYGADFTEIGDDLDSVAQGLFNEKRRGT